DRKRKEAMVETFATSVLQNMYVKDVKTHLEHHEKQSQKKKSKNRIFGDGMPKLMTGDDFFNTVVESEKEREKDKQEKDERRIINTNHTEVLREWKKEENVRLARNRAVQETYQKATKDWKEEDTSARIEGRRPRWEKPKQGKIKSFVPRPKKPTAAQENGVND
ncbi:hypothetical protein BDQ17DRAFT_1177712, partial [Cyathus striatus]